MAEDQHAYLIAVVGLFRPSLSATYSTSQRPASGSGDALGPPSRTSPSVGTRPPQTHAPHPPRWRCAVTAHPAPSLMQPSLGQPARQGPGIDDASHGGAIDVSVIQQARKLSQRQLCVLLPQGRNPLDMVREY